MNRRTLLASTGGIAVSLLAGCLATGANPDDPTDTDDGPTDTDDETPETDPTPTVRDHSIETRETSCMSGSETVDVTFESDGVSIQGVATAPTPCHEAVIDGASVEAGTLTVDLGLESEDGLCMECVGAIEYEASIALEGADGVDTVVVEHDDPGNSHTIEREDRSEPTGTESPTADGCDDHPDSIHEAANTPDPDLSISVANRDDSAHEIEVEVSRTGGETVFETTETVEPSTDREVYNLREADPDGIEAFTIEGRMGEHVESVEVETSACYGPVEVGVTEDGELYPVYAIC